MIVLFCSVLPQSEKYDESYIRSVCAAADHVPLPRDVTYVRVVDCLVGVRRDFTATRPACSTCNNARVDSSLLVPTSFVGVVELKRF
jgi:hypothetical protein